MKHIFIMEECCSSPGTRHTQDWCCPECVADHIADFFVALASWARSEKIRHMRENGALLQQGICPKCKGHITLLQIGREVWTSPCQHYHWQGRAS